MKIKRIETEIFILDVPEHNRYKDQLLKYTSYLTAIILWDISQRYMQTNYERGITHDGH